MTEALQRWARLVDEVNGRSRVGAPGVRDPDHLCDGFTPGLPDGDCETDGHYMCDECSERATCPECGLRPSQCEWAGCGAKGKQT